MGFENLSDPRRLWVRVKPGSRRAGVGGRWGDEDRLIVAVNARAVEGAANKAVAKAVADAFDVAPRSVSIVAGAKGRSKTVELADPPADFDTRLTGLLS